MTTPVRSEVTMDELETLSASGAGDLTKITLNGDSVPEEFRGKSAADVLAHLKSVQDILKQSETARQEALRNAEALRARIDTTPVAQPMAPVKEEVKELTTEELAEMMKEDPVKATFIMQQQSERRILRNLEQRIAPLAHSSADTAEADARRRYSEEFEVLGAEIAQVMQERVPDRSILSSPKVWDDMISYVRGQHFDKLHQHRVAQTQKKLETDAHTAAIAAAGGGASLTPSSRRETITPSKELDAIAKEVCRVQGITEDEYRKWSF